MDDGQMDSFHTVWTRLQRDDGCTRMDTLLQRYTYLLPATAFQAWKNDFSDLNSCLRGNEEVGMPLISSFPVVAASMLKPHSHPQRIRLSIQRPL